MVGLGLGLSVEAWVTIAISAAMATWRCMRTCRGV